MRNTAVACIGWLLFAVVGCEDNEELPECAIDLPQRGPLDTDGTRIIDQHGRTITLRGVNTGGRSKFAPYAPFEYTDGQYDSVLEAYLDRVEPWGFDVLRVPFSWEAIEPQQDQVDEAFLQRYDTLIDRAWEDHGLWTIVDFHQDIYAEVYCGDGFPAWTVEDPPEPHHDCPAWFASYVFDDDVKQAFDHFWADDTGVQTAYRGMWDLMATRYADHPGVIGFEPINEPGWGTGDRDTVMRDVLTPFYSEMNAFLHERDPDALVFFDSNGQDALVAETGLERPDGDRLVFAPHFYDPSVIMQQDDLDLGEIEASLQRWWDLGGSWDIPVLLGEFGIEHENDAVPEYLRLHYDFFDDRGMNATYWEYSVSHELWNHEVLSLTDGDGTVRTEVIEHIVRPYVRALAGTRVDDGTPLFDPETRVFSLTYEPDGSGISEIVLPTRIYSEGARITGSGACISRSLELLVQPDDGAGQVVVTVHPATK